MLDDHERKDSNYFYFSCRPAWPLNSLSFEFLGNECDKTRFTQCLKGLKKETAKTIAYWSTVSKSSYKVTAVAER